jgi:hypothetical protein
MVLDKDINDQVSFSMTNLNIINSQKLPTFLVLVIL